MRVSPKFWDGTWKREGHCFMTYRRETSCANIGTILEPWGSSAMHLQNRQVTLGDSCPAHSRLRPHSGICCVISTTWYRQRTRDMATWAPQNTIQLSVHQILLNPDPRKTQLTSLFGYRNTTGWTGTPGMNAPIEGSRGRHPTAAGGTGKASPHLCHSCWPGVNWVLLPSLCQLKYSQWPC